MSSSTNTAKPLPSERDYLRLDREEHDQRVVAAVSALDAQLSARRADPSAVSLVRVGTLEHFPCQYEDGFVAWRYHGPGGRDLVVRVPMEINTDEADAAVRRFMSELLEIQYRMQSR